MNKEQIQELKRRALAAGQDGEHIFTNARDSNLWQQNCDFHLAASPDAVLELIALAERATEAGTPATAGKIQRHGLLGLRDSRGDYVLYADHLTALEARAEEARREAEEKQATRIAHLTHERDLARRAVNVALEHHTDAAAQPVEEAAAQADGAPTNEELQRLWDERHAGHPADFAADVLERWGGWPVGVLGQGGSLAAPTAQPTPLSEYQPGQWWLASLESLWGHGLVDDDTRRAAKVACDFAAKVFAAESEQKGGA